MIHVSGQNIEEIKIKKKIEGGALPTYRAGDRGVASGRAGRGSAAARAQPSRSVAWPEHSLA